MRTKGLTRFLLACFSLVASSLAAAQGVRFSELHYDDIGVDDGERIEVAGPAGFDLSGWSVVLYNGATGVAYDTKALSGALPASCVDRGVAVVAYAVNGIQNGDPDGMALVNATGAVV
jgi:5'-nucleotidase